MQIELPKHLHQTSTACDHNNINEQINALVASRSSMASVSSSWKTLHMHCMDGGFTTSILSCMQLEEAL